MFGYGGEWLRAPACRRPASPHDARDASPSLTISSTKLAAPSSALPPATTSYALEPPGVLDDPVDVGVDGEVPNAEGERLHRLDDRHRRPLEHAPVT